MSERRAGLIVPLFTCPSSRSWGIGEIPDLVPMAAWLRGAGMQAWQLLPTNEMAPGQQSPYSAISAMAIDPVFIHLPAVPDFDALGGEGALSSRERLALETIRHGRIVDHTATRRLKRPWLRAAFERFVDAEWRRQTARARELLAFGAREAWWLDDYSVFRAIHARGGETPWTLWPRGLQQREPAAIERVRDDLGHEILFYQYLQWMADVQWRTARAQSCGVAVLGDLPFMVDGDSADVWARPGQFRLDISIGAPPDAFSAEGQDWGMPLYQWDVITRGGFEWLRKRARRCADLFDGYRIDHLVGFYRTYARPKDGSAPYFTPADERDQLALGEAILEVFREPGAAIIAEDLGSVPDFVRQSLARHRVPGFKVIRWERHWHTEGQPFRRPSEYPRDSVALSGTHDTEPMIVWWEEASPAERQKVAAVTSEAIIRAPYPQVRDILIDALFASGSDQLLMPMQDVFGWRDRVNDPAVVADSNWVFRLPWPSDKLDEIPEAREKQQQLRVWAEAHGR
jgi:4-alpha-glucanotransferase